MFLRNPETMSPEDIKKAIKLEDAMGEASDDFPEHLTVRKNKSSLGNNKPVDLGVDLDKIPC